MSENTFATSDGSEVSEDPKTEVAEEPKTEEVSVEPEKKEETEQVEKEEQEAKEVPESYEDFKLPEGYESNEVQMESFKGMAKELNLPQEEAQKLVDYHFQVQKEGLEAQVESWKQTQEEWRSATKNDKEIGGEKIKETRADVGRAVDKFGNDDFKNLLDITGVGDHVEMVRFLSKVGQLLKEDTTNIQGARPPNQAAVDPAKVMFPNQN